MGFPSLLFHPCEGYFLIEVIENIFGCHAGGFIRGHCFARVGAPGPELFRFLIIQSHQERRHRQLAATVDAHEHQVLGVEFEVEPGTAVGNDACREQEFARRMGLALVVIEKYPRRTVHLGNDDPLRAIDDEGAVVGHQRHITHENVLFLDVADGAGLGFLVDVPNDETQGHLQRRRVGHSPLLAFLDVVFRQFELVFDEFQGAPLREVLDRKNRLENLLQAAVGADVGVRFPLQELLV